MAAAAAAAAVVAVAAGVWVLEQAEPVAARKSRKD